MCSAYVETEHPAAREGVLYDPIGKAVDSIQLDTTLTKLVKRAYAADGVVVAHVYGRFGAGKTSYALWTARAVLGSWRQVLKHLFFYPQDALRFLTKAVRRGDRVKVIILDDAGLWLDKHTWWTQDKVAFFRFFNVVRSVAAGVIFTTPSDDLPKAVKDMVNIRVKVETVPRSYVVQRFREAGKEHVLNDIELRMRVFTAGREPQWSVAKGYVLVTLPSFMQVVRKHFNDIYPMQYPVIKEYSKLRNEAVRRSFAELRKAVGGTPPREKRGIVMDLIELAIRKGASKTEIAKVLKVHGMPKSTLYKYIREVEARVK